MAGPIAEKQNTRVVLIPGDGIGPEITDAVLLILDRAGAGIEWQRESAGLGALEQLGDSLPKRTLDAILETHVCLKGPLTTPVSHSSSSAEAGFRSVNIRLRQALDLYANLRPVCSLPGVKSRYENIDLVFIRENTEGLYSGLEQEIVPGVVTSLKVATRKACLRVAEFAFAFARQNSRKKVTGVHKANIMKLSDGLALECYREVASRYPDIEYEERIIDATAMALVMYPERFDVLLMENLYGDILSDLGAGLVGGLGLAPSANIGTAGAIFEAVHGSAPDIAGKGVANPTALLLSAVAMLRHLGQGDCAHRIEEALLRTLRAQRQLTKDLGGSATTAQFASEVTRQL